MVILIRSLFLGIFIIWQTANIIYIDSLGSLRQSLPQNIVSWLSIAMIIAIISLMTFYMKYKVLITIPAICFFLALIILILDLLISDTKKNDLNFWYWSGIAAGVILYIAGLQIKDSWLTQSLCIYCYIFFSCLQALLTFYQYFFEADIFYLASGMRSNGLSQQINVLSVNMATACLLAITTLILSQFTLLKKSHENARITFLGIVIFIFTSLIIVLQSITTWISFFVSIFIFICLFYNKNKVRVSAGYFVIAIAIFIGVYLVKFRTQYIEADLINQFHLKQMLRFSITLFLEQPYEAWQTFSLQDNSYERVAIPFLSPNMYIVPHSKNEIFLWMMTGGYINLTFMSLLLTGGIYVVAQAFIKYKINGNGYPLAIILAICPMVIHCNVEYPFLLSVLHWGLIILFLSFSDAAFALEKQKIFFINKQLSSLFSLVLFILGLGVFVIGLFLFNGENSFYTKDHFNSKSIITFNSINLNHEKI